MRGLRQLSLPLLRTENRCNSPQSFHLNSWGQFVSGRTRGTISEADLVERYPTKVYGKMLVKILLSISELFKEHRALITYYVIKSATFFVFFNGIGGKCDQKRKNGGKLRRRRGKLNLF